MYVCMDVCERETEREKKRERERERSSLWGRDMFGFFRLFSLIAFSKNRIFHKEGIEAEYQWKEENICISSMAIVLYM